MQQTTIEWTDATWNVVTGCTKVSAGCTHCYAERLFPRPYPGRAFTDVQCHPERLEQPLHWRKPRKVFVNSMSDLFHEAVPDAFLDQVFAVMALCPRHVFQILTKRPEQMRLYMDTAPGWVGEAIQVLRQDTKPVLPLPHGQGGEPWWPLPNVWLGVSAEDQQRADERIPVLLDTPAAVRFVSAEPLLSSVDLSKWLHDGTRERVSGTGSIRSFFRGAGRNDMAFGEMDGRRARIGTDLYRQEAGRAQHRWVEQLPASDVQGWLPPPEGKRSPNCLDANTPSPHSGGDGDQPLGREQTEQPPVESRSCDAPTERPTLPYDACTEEKGPAGGTQFIGGSDGIASSRNSCDVAIQSNVTKRDSREIRYHAIDGIRNRSAQELETPALNWVIVGGESGPGARLCRIEWVRTLRDQCQAAAVPFFFKQWGRWVHISQMPEEAFSRVSTTIEADPAGYWPVGKKLAGHLLDRVMHQAFPQLKEVL